MRRPAETSRWFSGQADEILKRVKEAEASQVSGNEALSTITDLKILAWLARYYAAWLNAAVDYNLYRQNGDVSALDVAIEHERAAVAVWAEIVAAAGDVYSQDLAFGVHGTGFPRHWKEELDKLQLGLNKLVEERKQPSRVAAATRPPRPAVFSDIEPPRVRLEPPGKARPGEDLLVAAKVEDASGVQTVRLRYRRLTQFEDYQTADMTLGPETGLYAARIPGDFIKPKWDLMYFIEALDRHGNGRNYPDLEVETPYVIVPVARPLPR